jgi:transposase
VSGPPQINIPPHSDPFLVEYIALLQQQLDAQSTQLQSATQELDYSRLRIQLLEERLRRARINKYGKHSEKLSDLQLALLELEPAVSSEEVEAESQRPPLTEPATEDQPRKKRRRRHPGRQRLPEHLKRVEKIISCEPTQCVCSSCGQETTVIGYEESEVLDVKPADYFVQVTKREKRACKCCEEQGVKVARVPERIIPKSILSDTLIIDTIVSKYCDGMPLYRQRAAIRRDAGIDIHLATLNNTVLRAGELFLPVVRCMGREIVAGSYIQADETFVQVQTHDKRGKHHQGYLWQYGSPHEGTVVFDFQMSRKGIWPKQFLAHFKGILQTDGWVGYDDIKNPGIIHTFCWSHGRRKFVDAVKNNAADLDSAAIVKLIDELFAIDRKARDEGITVAERQALRRELAPRILDELHPRLEALRHKALLPSSLAAEAANYTLKRWEQLKLFLEYAELELSNNLAENSMRGISIGRRNWLHIGSKEAAPKIAAIFSIVESCRRLDIPIRQYLADVLPGLADRSIQALPRLTPAVYAATRKDK